MSKICIYAKFVVTLHAFCWKQKIGSMFLYFLLIRIAALFGHKKARALVEGQKSAFSFEPSVFSGCIWIHAASAGEFEQARTLIERIKDASLQDGASAYRSKER